LALTSYNIYVFIISFDLSVLQYILHSYMVDLYYEFLVTLLLKYLLSVIHKGYEALNCKLCDIQTKPKLEESMKELIQNYRILSETIQLFNSLFGYQLLLIIFHCGLH